MIELLTCFYCEAPLRRMSTSKQLEGCCSSLRDLSLNCGSSCFLHILRYDWRVLAFIALQILLCWTDKAATDLFLVWKKRSTQSWQLDWCTPEIPISSCGSYSSTRQRHHLLHFHCSPYMARHSSHPFQATRFYGCAQIKHSWMTQSSLCSSTPLLVLALPLLQLSSHCLRTQESPPFSQSQEAQLKFTQHVRNWLVLNSWEQLGLSHGRLLPKYPGCAGHWYHSSWICWIGSIQQLLNQRYLGFGCCL